MILPDACSPGTTPIYRVFSNRLTRIIIGDDRTRRDAMVVAHGWLAEGDGVGTEW